MAPSPPWLSWLISNSKSCTNENHDNIRSGFQGISGILIVHKSQIWKVKSCQNHFIGVVGGSGCFIYREFFQNQVESFINRFALHPIRIKTVHSIGARISGIEHPWLPFPTHTEFSGFNFTVPYSDIHPNQTHSKVVINAFIAVIWTTFGKLK